MGASFDSSLFCAAKGPFDSRMACCRCFSSITQEILISEVLIIMILIPSRERTSNIFAATPEWESEITARMDATVARLTAGGARVVVVTQAPPAPNPAQGTETYDRAADDAGYSRLDDLLRRFATRHRGDVSLFDLADRLCPDGPPCPERIDGLHARPDGRHFTPTAAVWAARMLLSETFGAG